MYVPVLDRRSTGTGELNFLHFKLTNFSVQFLALVRLKVLGEEVHHLVDCLVERILVHDTPLLSSPFGIVVPSEPTNGMEAIALEYVATVKGAVVIDQQNIARLHGKRCDALLRRPLDLLAVFQIEWFHGIGIEYLRHSYLGHATGSTIAQLSGVVVCIIEPYRHARDGMAIDG